MYSFIPDCVNVHVDTTVDTTVHELTKVVVVAPFGLNDGIV